MKIQVSLKSGRSKGYLHKVLCTLMIESGSTLLRIRNVFKQKLYRKSRHTFYIQ